jgi:hydrogenase maturation protease
VTPPTLIFAYGNPSRGDDALGPLFLERVGRQFQGEIAAGELELLGDFQLQVEHALDLAGRARVLFVDASVSCAEPFALTEVLPLRDTSFTSHSLTPAALLHVYENTTTDPRPPAWILCIRGYHFELGEGLTAQAAANLDAALHWSRGWVAGFTLA